MSNLTQIFVSLNTTFQTSPKDTSILHAICKALLSQVEVLREASVGLAGLSGDRGSSALGQLRPPNLGAIHAN